MEEARSVNTSTRTKTQSVLFAKNQSQIKDTNVSHFASFGRLSATYFTTSGKDSSFCHSTTSAKSFSGDATSAKDSATFGKSSSGNSTSGKSFSSESTSAKDSATFGKSSSGNSTSGKSFSSESTSAKDSATSAQDSATSAKASAGVIALTTSTAVTVSAAAAIVVILSSVSGVEIAVIAALAVFGVAAVLIILYVLWRNPRDGESYDGFYSNQVRTFKYEELESATNTFAETNVLGKGGFGVVYRGALGGEEVAIKKLKPDGHQGEREFRAEVETISRVHHRNLVSLVGYCRPEDQRLLVYEYVPNKTLDFHLHTRGLVGLDWPKRWGIALGSARGLAYLHDDCRPKIIHRDIKAANILLDDNFEPKVADFGLAKFVPTDMSHVSTQVKGTFGYIAPEYAASGRFTDRSDVYSYGVMLLELITGKKALMSSPPSRDPSLVNWARPLLLQAIESPDTAFTRISDTQLVDASLGTNFDQYQMIRLFHCAAAAVQYLPINRPSMSKIVRYLEGEITLSDLNASMMPGESEVRGGLTEEVEAFRRMALGREDYAESSNRRSDNTPSSSSSASMMPGDSEVELTRMAFGSEDTPSSSSSATLTRWSTDNFF